MNVKVLIVDDLVFMCKLFSQLFLCNGLEVVIVCDGEEVIDVVVWEKFDVIILDINMLKMDGIMCLSLFNKMYFCLIIMFFLLM